MYLIDICPMSEVLEYFLDEVTLVSEVDFPDRGIDYVFMLEPSEWDVISEHWEKGSVAWKEAITFFAGFVWLDLSDRIILSALYDSNSRVVLQALFSLYESITTERMTRESMDFGNKTKAVYPFNANDKDRILNAIERYTEDSNKFPELEALREIVLEKN